MFPFFAGNVVRDYTAWRPLWLLGVFWALCLAHVALELVHGYAWLPVTFALYSAQSLAYLLTGVFWLNRAPAHALFIGFFGSVLIAMVTRVTQGHSGRELVMPRVAWFAFVAIQCVAVLRIGAEFAADPMLWQAIATVGWLIALGPWVARLGMIYLSPRIDGKPG